MKKFYLSFLFLLGLSVSGLSAQVVEKVLDILGKDSLPASAAAVTADSDSVSLAAVRQELAAAKLNEANLRMEIEHRCYHRCCLWQSMPFLRHWLILFPS